MRRDILTNPYNIQAPPQSSEAKSVRFTLSPWGLEKEEAEGASVVVNFWPALRSGHVSLLIRNFRRQTWYAKQSFSLGTSPSRSQGHSVSRRVNHPDDTHPSEESAPPRTLLLPRASPLQDKSFPSWARRPQLQTLLISTYIHGVCYVARSSHVSNVAITPALMRTVTEGSRNCSRYQE